MADTKISALTHATTPLVGTERFALSDGTATSKYATAADLFTNPVHASYDDFTAIANPAAPGAGVGRLYAESYVGRVVPAWINQNNVDTPLQSALWNSEILVGTPASGTTLASCIQFLGGALTIAGGGTVLQVTPTSTSRVTQMRRTRLTNVVTTTNQVIGVHGSTADMASFWRGNAAGLGGYFMFARFCTALWPANTCRLFVGFRSGTTAIVASDTFPAVSMCGFSHITTDGGTTINFVTKDGTTANSSAITVPTLGNDVGFDAYIYMAPNGGSVFYRLDRLDTGATLVDTSTSTNIPATTTFMAPELAMSNGTANITANTVAIGINKLYCESDV